MIRLVLLSSALSLTTACSTVGTDSDAQATVKAMYDGFEVGDIGLATSTMSPDIIWLEAEGNPYADLNPYVGPDAIVSRLFARVATDWNGWSAAPEEYVVDGERVVVFGRYAAINKVTGDALDIPFVHSFRVSDDLIVTFQQYTDTDTLAGELTGY